MSSGLKQRIDRLDRHAVPAPAPLAIVEGDGTGYLWSPPGPWRSVDEVPDDAVIMLRLGEGCRMDQLHGGWHPGELAGCG
jgi:hypothetical protein